MSTKLRKRKSSRPEQISRQEKADEKQTASQTSHFTPRNTALLCVLVIALLGITALVFSGVIDYKIFTDTFVQPEELQTKGKEDIAKDLSSIKESQKEKDVLQSVSEDLNKDISGGKAQVVAEKDDTSKSSENKQKSESNSAKQKSKKSGSKASKTDQFTSEKDKPILKQLQEGNSLLKKKKAKEALALFEELLKSNPESPRAWFGKAESLNIKSLQDRSNKVLMESLKTYEQVMALPDTPEALKKKAGLIKAERHQFLGQIREAMQTTVKLVREFPRDVEILNQLGISYLYAGKNDKAQKVYEQVLAIDPDNGFAQVHLGFVIKVAGDWVKGAQFLKLGIQSLADGTQEGKFYFHLGDALHRTNRTTEAEEIYELGASRGLFRSKYQRSLYNIDRLQSHPFWTPEQAKVSDYVKKLESKWKIIRDEALKIMDVEKGLFLAEEESLKDTGDWKQLTLYARGKKEKDCSRLPKTCALVSNMPNAHGCTRGQIKFSIMMPGTHVWPHTGPTNCRLRMHLGLVIPKTGEGAWLRCAEETRTWEEGKILIFDDSFEHEVWQNAESFRLILIIDVWHPDITEREKKTLSPI